MLALLTHYHEWKYDYIKLANGFQIFHKENSYVSKKGGFNLLGTRSAQFASKSFNGGAKRFLDTSAVNLYHCF